MNGAKTLYLIGWIRGTKLPVKNISLQQAWNDYSKNGAYAVAAIECLKRQPQLSLSELWVNIKDRIITELGKNPAANNAGAATVAFKLWHMGMIVGG